MGLLKWIGLVIVTLGAAAACLHVYGSMTWTRQTKALVNKLESIRKAPAAARFDARELEGLPAPVQRYFRTALKNGQAVITAVSVDHAGMFNIGEASDNWKPFTSRQRVTTNPPGFVWNGQVSMMPGLPVRVHDAYVAGEGILHPAILGLFTLIDMRGTPDVAQGELMRFFAEAAWYPTALLPSQGVRWQAADDHSAHASLTDGQVALTMLFRFSGDGLIESIRAEARGRTVGKAVVMTPWEGRWFDYQKKDGMRVPMRGEVAWLTPEGRKPYWRGTITRLEYEFAE